MDGSIKMKCMYINNVRNGKEIYYYPNGKIYYDGQFGRGLREGKWIYYNDQGLVDTTIYYNE